MEREKFDSFIDFCIAAEEDPENAGKIEDVFLKALTWHFFYEESDASRSMEQFFSTIQVPEFIRKLRSILDVNMDELTTFVQANTINESLAAKVFLSAAYLKFFQPHHPPKFTKMPEEVQNELLKKIKGKNGQIIAEFEKMKFDRAADKSRSILSLVAMVIKNIHIRNEMPLNTLQKPAADLISSIFPGSDEVFRGSQKQMVNLSDDRRIKDIVKLFFNIKNFNDMSAASEMFKKELEKLRKRALLA
jgi:hypothetical protein